jgi:hypothetical protein
MRRSHPTPLLGLGLAGLVIGFLLELAAAASGSPILVPPLTLPLTLLAVAVIVVLLAWPIRQSTRGDGSGKPVNPFVAMRVAVLAKASSLSGSLLLGAGAGIVLYLLTRSVVPAVSSVVLAAATAAGAAVLLAGGLVAEYFCTLPPGDDTDDPGEARV